MTQGLITIVQGGNVLVKIIAGSNGFNIEKAKEQILKNPGVIRDSPLLYMKILHAEFGSKNDLVIINPAKIFHKCNEEPSDLYRSTFHIPDFNPRWESGEVGHYELIEL